MEDQRVAGHRITCIQIQITYHVTNQLKLIMSYGTPMEPVLRAQQVDTLVVAGVSTTWAVQSVVRDALDRDFRVFVIEDACAAVTLRSIKRRSKCFDRFLRSSQSPIFRTSTKQRNAHHQIIVIDQRHSDDALGFLAVNNGTNAAKILCRREGAALEVYRRQLSKLEETVTFRRLECL